MRGTEWDSCKSSGLCPERTLPTLGVRHTSLIWERRAMGHTGRKITTIMARRHITGSFSVGLACRGGPDPSASHWKSKLSSCCSLAAGLNQAKHWGSLGSCIGRVAGLLDWAGGPSCTVCVLPRPLPSTTGREAPAKGVKNTSATALRGMLSTEADRPFCLPGQLAQQPD